MDDVVDDKTPSQWTRKSLVKDYFFTSPIIEQPTIQLFPTKGDAKVCFQHLQYQSIIYTHMLFWEVNNYFSKLNFSFKGVYYIFKGYL